MRRLRTKSADDQRKLRPHQYCNDWISVNYADTGEAAGIVSPTQVVLDPEDFEFFAARDPNHSYHETRYGTFWQEFTLNNDGTFSRKNQVRRELDDLARLYS